MRSFNPDLPILDEIGRELEQLAGVASVSTPMASPVPMQPAATPPALRRRGAHGGGRRTARVTRRAAVVFVLLCLVGGVAVAARFAGGGDGTPSHTAPTLLGRAGGGAWHLSGYRDQGRLCFLLTTPGAALTSECGSEPPADGVRATSLRAGRDRLVAGLAGRLVGAVEVRVDDRRTRVATHGVTDREAAADAGVPLSGRWFVAVLPASGTASSGLALVTPLSQDGKLLGKPYLDCSLSVVGPACERRIRAAASAAERGD